MDGRELETKDAEDVCQVIRALGAHRYVRSRLLLVHAALFVIAERYVSDALREEVAEGAKWAKETFAHPSIDPSSRDPLLWRKSSEKEICALLRTFWIDAPHEAQADLRAWLLSVGLPFEDRPPFDESNDAVHPTLIDAGWELLSYSQLTYARHQGLIDQFDDEVFFEAAKFEETSAMEMPVYLHELPAFGPNELLSAFDERGLLREPLIVWTSGPDRYHDYVLSGVARAARLG